MIIIIRDGSTETLQQMFTLSPKYRPIHTKNNIYENNYSITIIILVAKPTGDGTCNHSWLTMLLGKAQQSGSVRTGYTQYLIPVVTRLHSSQMCLVTHRQS